MLFNIIDIIYVYSYFPKPCTREKVNLHKVKFQQKKWTNV